MRNLILASLTIALLTAFAPQAQAVPLCRLASGARGFVARRVEGVQHRHQRRVERRQSGGGVARLAPRNW